MKLRSKKYLLFDLVIVSIVVSLLFLFMWSLISPKSIVKGSSDDWSSYRMLGSKENFDVLQDSMQKLKNQINILSQKIHVKQGNLVGVGGYGGQSFGISKYSDSIHSQIGTYLTTEDWGMVSDSTLFETVYYSKHGKSYVRHPVISKLSKHHFSQRYKNEEVKFKYDLSEKKILLPLRSSYQQSIANICLCIMIIFSVFAMLLGIVLFIRFLISVSLNRIFEAYNIFRLSLISLCCFFVVLFPYLVALILYIIYYKELSAGVTFMRKFSSIDYCLIVGGVFFALLYRAFKKGVALKEENELTV